ncbi:hypothetical protein PFISCL1PPCAC_7084, partial [Pristionchus fissidentatus]
TDERLEWNITWANGLQTLFVPIDDIWLPPFYTYNALAIIDFPEYLSICFRIKNNGNIKWCRNEAITVRCELQMDYFPFDSQRPAMHMRTSAFSTAEMTIRGGEVNEWVGFGEFEVESVTTGFDSYVDMDSERRPEVQYTMAIRRSPLHYIVFVVIPTTLTTMTSLTGVFLAEANEPIITIGFTTLLAHSYMLNILSTVLPKSGNISLIVYFLIGNMILTVFTVFAAMLMLKLSRIFEKRSSAPNPTISQLLCICREEKGEGQANTICGLQKIEDNDGPEFCRSTAVLINSYLDRVRAKEENRLIKERRVGLQMEW